MILSCLSATVAWTTIIANIVTSLGIIGIFFTIRSVTKNRVTKRTFTCDLQRVQKAYIDEKITEYRFDLHIVNFTDNDCSISSIVLQVNGTPYETFQKRFINNWIEYVKVKDIYIKAHISITLEGILIRLSDDTEIKKITLLLDTTAGKLNYILNIADF